MTNIDQAVERAREHILGNPTTDRIYVGRDAALAALDELSTALSESRSTIERLEGERDEAIAHAWDFENGEAYYRLHSQLEQLQRERDRLKEALWQVAEMQPKVLGYIQANGFKWEGEDSLGTEPGNWQHLAFSIYSDLCQLDSIARNALSSNQENET